MTNRQRKTHLRPLAVCWVVIAAALAPLAFAQVGTTTRASVSTKGEQGYLDLWSMGLSANGRYVVFASYSDNLVAGDTNNERDIFLRDLFAGTTIRVSTFNGQQANGVCSEPSVSDLGPRIVFQSDTWNWIQGVPSGLWMYDASTGITSLVSVSTNGTPGNEISGEGSITPDGRHIVFRSRASNLVANDGNGRQDYFVRDVFAGTTELVSISSTGQQHNGDVSLEPSISDSGRFVAFSCSANNLVLGDTNNTFDIFLRDRQGSTTARVSVSNTGSQSNGVSDRPQISGDGRFVAFESDASNLVQGDTNAKRDVFVRDTLLETTERVSVSSLGEQGNGMSLVSSLSEDGRFVGFASSASNLVAGDTNDRGDSFVHDRVTGVTIRVSISTIGEQANGSSGVTLVNADSSVIAFLSLADNLVPGDTNNEEDVFVLDKKVLPLTSHQIVRGIVTSGDFFSLAYSDDDRLVMRPGITFSTSVPPISVVVETTTTEANPSSLHFRIESSGSAPTIAQFVELYNFSNGVYEAVDTRSVSLGDIEISISATGDLGRFVGPNSELRTRISYRATGPVFAYPWQARIDRVQWSLR